MARKKRDDGGGGSWLDTYADMVTLLLTFFILLFSMSSLDKAKASVLMEAFSKSQSKLTPKNPGAEGVDAPGSEVLIELESAETMQDVFQYISNKIQSSDKYSESVDVEMINGKIFIRLSNNILFEPNSYIVKYMYYDLLDILGEAFLQIEGQISMIEVMGHTAMGSNGQGISDIFLSTNRAAAVTTYFQDFVGIDPKKTKSTGFGKERPIANNATEEGKSKNRRVEILVTGIDVDTELDYIYNIIEEKQNEK